MVDPELPLIVLMTVATARERETLAIRMRERGFDGVATPELRLLAELRDGPRSIQALARSSGTTKQFCAREVRKLAALGCVATGPGADDRRTVEVTLAPRGTAALIAAAEVKRELDRAIDARLGPDDARTLRGLLVRLLADPDHAKTS
ncbi:MAG: MarR family winged helix-turn-helix transcriptional regulator [Myxococcota bacterium]